MKRVLIKTETVDRHTDGTESTTRTERIEEQSSNGLLEAWAALVLLLFTLLLFAGTYRVISSISQQSQNQGNSNEIQRLQLQ